MNDWREPKHKQTCQHKQGKKLINPRILINLQRRKTRGHLQRSLQRAKWRVRLKYTTNNATAPQQNFETNTDEKSKQTISPIFLLSTVLHGKICLKVFGHLPTPLGLFAMLRSSRCLETGKWNMPIEKSMSIDNYTNPASSNMLK